MKNENMYRVTIEQWSEAHGRDIQFCVDITATNSMDAISKIQKQEELQYPAARVVSADLIVKPSEGLAAIASMPVRLKYKL